MKDWIEFEISNGIGLMRMTRPSMNIMDMAYLNTMADKFEELTKDDDLQALVVTGQDGIFSAGLDLKTVPFYDPDEQQRMLAAINRAFGRLYCFPRPTIAAINGHAIAGGMVLALCCDYRIARDDECQLGLAEVRVGVPYPIAAIEAAASELPRQAGRNMILFGRDIDAKTALDWGAVDRLTPAEDLMEAAMDKARELAQIPRYTYTKVKRQYRRTSMERIEDVQEKKRPATKRMAHSRNHRGGAGHARGSELTGRGQPRVFLAVSGVGPFQDRVVQQHLGQNFA